LSSTDDIKIARFSDVEENSNAKTTLSKIRDYAPNFCIGCGDYAHDTGSSVVQSWWDNVIKPNIPNMKIYPVMGNHDTGDSAKYQSLFGNSNWVYSFSYKNIFFLMLNSEAAHSIGSSQYSFALAELKKSVENPSAVSAEFAAAPVKFRICCFHEPIFNSSNHHGPKTTFREAMAPLFDKYHVDLCLSGHNHNYERTFPITYDPSNPSKPKIENDSSE